MSVTGRRNFFLEWNDLGLKGYVLTQYQERSRVAARKRQSDLPNFQFSQLKTPLRFCNDIT
jgi:hypothetical protein